MNEPANLSSEEVALKRQLAEAFLEKGKICSRIHELQWAINKARMERLRKK